MQNDINQVYHVDGLLKHEQNRAFADLRRPTDGRAEWTSANDGQDLWTAGDSFDCCRPLGVEEVDRRQNRVYTMPVNALGSCDFSDAHFMQRIMSGLVCLYPSVWLTTLPMSR
ncbi:unnamed protein product [Protopolystoma xenopodis]|uniref:Uncharacterized protein n=1 Tax=Protopolystoma xenopodis TaxID=117903 RepID=A0A3S5FG16_9PLAT|nr:unnamed protein product [Protopolystoma xenopodis]